MGLLALLDKALGGGWSTLPAPTQEMKLYAIDDFRAALTTNTLVHGPGATDHGWRGADGNSAVFACLMALSKSFIEPPLRVYSQGRTGDREWLADHPLQQLLDRPNPHHDAKELWWWVQWAKHCDGNAYVHKIRSGNERTGNVVQLWPISPALCAPWRDDRSSSFIDAYKYQYAPGKFEYIDPSNIIHFRLGVDDRDMRLGLSPLKRLVRFVSGDDAAARHSDALLRNFAVPGLMVTWDKDTANIDRATAEEIKQRVTASFSGENAGKVAALSPGATMQQFGFSPADLNLETLHAIPESRICAVMGVPPAIVQLMIGLKQTSNYASMREVREMFTESTLMPEWQLDAAKVNHGLRPDFDSQGRISVAFDTTEVRALQEDKDKQVVRLNVAVQGGWITPNEARSEFGLPPIAGLDGPPAETDAPPALRIVKAIAEAKARGMGHLPELYAELVELARPAFEAELADFQAAQHERVRRALTGGVS